MLKPEQVPNAVVDALWSATGDHPVGVLSSRYEAKLYLAAAINAWPGMGRFEDETGWDVHIELPLLVPLNTEPRDE